MPRKFKFCMQCRRTIFEDEIRRGLYVQSKQGMLCATCAQRLDEETEAAKQAAEAIQAAEQAAEAAKAAEQAAEAAKAAEQAAEAAKLAAEAAEAAKAAEAIALEPVPAEPPAPVIAKKPETPPAPPPPPPTPTPPAAPPELPEEAAVMERTVPQAVTREPEIQEPAAETPVDPPPAAPHARTEPPAQVLEGIREHVEAIRRTLVFEKSSPWNVLAAVAQCLAVGMLIIAAVEWADNPMHLLLVALIFQVMALTFFVRGK